MFNNKSKDDDKVLSFMREGIVEYPKKSVLGPLRTFARVETGSTITGRIPRGAIEAQEENEGVVFTKPVYRLAPTPVTVAASSELTFDPFKAKSVFRSPGPKHQNKAHEKKSSSLQPPFLPAFPYELERFGHVFSNCDMKDIKSSIEKEFKSSKADFEFDSSKWKWSVYTYEGNKSCHVSVRIFRCFEKKDLDCGKLVVEFHKRKGCGWGYHRWLSKVYNNLIDAEIAMKGTEKLRCCKTAFDMSQCFRSGDDKSNALEASDLKPLIGMAKAHCSAVQAEAFREIAQIGQRDRSSHVLILQTDILKDKSTSSFSQNGLLETVRRVLRDDVDIDVSRCAACALRVLSSCPKTRSLFRNANETDSLITSICSYLKKPRKLSERQTQRECVSALRLLSGADSDKNGEVNRILDAFQHLAL